MKSSIAVIAMLALLVPTAAARATDDDRRAWWDDRVRELRAERTARTARTPLELRLRDALDRDITRAESMRAAFDRSAGGATSARADAPIAPARVRALAAEIVPPIIALHTLDRILARHDPIEPDPGLRRIVGERCAERLRAADPGIAPDAVGRLVSDHIRAEEWRLIAWELFMDRAISEHDARTASLVGRCADETIAALERKTIPAVDRSVRAHIAARAMTHGAQMDIEGSARIGASTVAENVAARLVRMQRLALGPSASTSAAHRAAVEGELHKRSIAIRAAIAFLESLVGARQSLPEAALAPSLTLVSAQNKRIAALAKRLDAAGAIDAADRRFLDRAALTRHRETRSQSREDAKRLVAHAGLAAKHLTQKQAQVTADGTRARQRLRERLAHGEIDSLMESAQDLLAIYRAITHADDAFARYQDAFAGMQNAASDGAQHPGLDCALQAGSVIPAVPHFDAERITAEHRIKSDLRKHIMLRLAQASRLAKTYAQRGVSMKNMITPERTAEITRALSRESAARIASWRMDESNVAAIDRKAVEHLRAIRNRQAWRDGAGKLAGARTVSVPEAGITLTLPASVVERAPIGAEIEKGVIRAFATPDGKGVFYVSRPAPLDAAPEDATDLWLSTMGNTAVSDRWGTQESRAYYWTLSRDRRAQVMETMTVNGARGPVIIAGVTTKSRYNFFKQHIDALFQSVKF
ncbi:MAG TPA: hypothetical protein PLE73_04325 [Spirochaetota bacterium]|nr:hypothetical protein [Spirochaetota bacterium]HOS38875.1 hypothetical protein [Spirochaetota bacterium]HPI22396.1 hypothetical protein [Spirochaetota bacterium]HPU88145.1 hypothetical protein [Spirochaetota bacterium]